MNQLDQLALSQSRVLLSKMEGVELLGDWEPAASNSNLVWMLPLRLQLLGAAPTEEVPLWTKWAIVIDFDTDPWGKVQLHPANDGEGLHLTFEHQQYNGGPHPVWPVRNGHVCSLTEMHGLAASRNAMESQPIYTIDRISWHVGRAQAWLSAAAAGELTRPGDPFELPDFHVGEDGRKGSLVFYEDSGSYARWLSSMEYAGIASYSFFQNAFIIRQFKDRRGREIIYEPAWGTLVRQLPETRSAVWLRLDAVPVMNRWQVPTTMADLAGIINQQGKDLKNLLKPALENLKENGEWLLFMGFPVPEKIGAAPVRFHWQAFSLAPPARKKDLSRFNITLNRLISHSAIPWIARAENWHPNELQNRGRVKPSLQESRVLILGAGALGATLAEQLVRMGVQDLTVVDFDYFEAGNLVRHSLDMTHLSYPKALAMADRLNRINPSARVQGLAVSILKKDDAFATAARTATLILDATGSDEVLRELPFTGLSPEVPIISLSLGLHAQRLFFYADRAADFSSSAFQEWFWPFRHEEHLAARQEEMPRGLGCWHPLTPAPLNRIAGLAGVAVELVEQVCAGQATLPVGYCHQWQVPSLALALKKAAS